MKRMTITQAVIEGLTEEMERDPSIIVLGQDVVGLQGQLGAYEGMPARFPTRMFDTSISETAMLAVSMGAAMSGTRTVVDLLFSEYLGVGLSSALVDAGSAFYYSAGAIKVPMLVRLRYGVGLYRGHPGDYHHWLMSPPGVKVFMPSNAKDAKGLVKSALRDDGPVFYFDHMALLHSNRVQISDEESLVPLGRAAIARPGKDMTVIAAGMMVHHALAAAAEAAGRGVDVEVLDLRTVVPLDYDRVLESARKTRRVIVAQESWIPGGYASEVAAFLATQARDVLCEPVVRIGAAPLPVPHHPALEDVAVPGRRALSEAVARMVGT